jgi:hypothetical protein
MQLRIQVRVLRISATVLALGCAYASPIQPAATSSSPFWWFGWGDPVQVASAVPPGEQFRISHRGSTGFTSVASVRGSAEARADKFCEKRNALVSPVTEQASSGPQILGNFPRFELVFVCVDRPTTQALPSDDPYVRIKRLKELLDSGAITQQEFDREKAKLLGP